MYKLLNFIKINLQNVKLSYKQKIKKIKTSKTMHHW